MEIIQIKYNLFMVKNVKDKITGELFDEAYAKTSEELEEKFTEN